MDIKKIIKLIEMIKGSSIAEIEVSVGKESIRISRYSAILPDTVVAPIAPIPATLSPVIDKPVEPVVAEQTLNNHTIKSPVSGTFYLAASPIDSPFVEVGQSVSVGDIVCVIEAMKTLNQIEAEKNGVIKQILADNGQPVENDQSLFIIELR